MQIGLLGPGRDAGDRVGVAPFVDPAGFVDAVEVGREPVVLLLRQRVELVVVTLCARECQSHPDGGGGVGAVQHVFDPVLLGDPAALSVERMVAVESGGDQLSRVSPEGTRSPAN